MRKPSFVHQATMERNGLRSSAIVPLVYCSKTLTVLKCPVGPRGLLHPNTPSQCAVIHP